MRAFWIVLLGVLWASPGAFAKDPTPAESLRLRLEASRKDRDGAEWLVALKQLPSIYAAAQEKERAKLMREAGSAFQKGTPLVQKAALSAIVATDDGDVAWKQALRHVFPDPKAKVAGTWDIEVLKALYVLRADASIDPLLRLMKKGKVPATAAGALRVLGTFEESRRRVYVLEEVVQIIVANLPGRSINGSRGSDRFRAMATQLQATLNDLTGQNYNLQQWGLAWKEHKKHPQALFVNPLPKK